MWQLKLRSKFVEMGFINSTHDPCLFRKRDGKKIMLIRGICRVVLPNSAAGRGKGCEGGVNHSHLSYLGVGDDPITQTLRKSTRGAAPRRAVASRFRGSSGIIEFPHADSRRLSDGSWRRVGEEASVISVRDFGQCCGSDRYEGMLRRLALRGSQTRLVTSIVEISPLAPSSP